MACPIVCVGYHPIAEWANNENGSTSRTASDETEQPGGLPIPNLPLPADPLPGGASRQLEFGCPSCVRSFNTKSGLGVHHRRAHPDEYAVSAECVQKNKRWSQEEMQRVAALEVELEGAQFINVELQKRHPSRITDSIKGLRRRPDYQAYVTLPRTAVRGIESTVVIEVPIYPDQSDSELITAVSTATVRPLPNCKTESLEMVAASVAAADKATTLALLGNYLRDVFPPRPTNNCLLDQHVHG